LTPAAVVLATAAAASVALAPVAAAHTGGGTHSAVEGLLHPVTGVDHLLAMVAVGVLAATVSRSRIAWSIPAGFVGGMLAGAGLGLAGVGFPGVEVVIAASVVLLGALLGALGGSGDRAGWWVAALAVGLGAAHGHAHGAELPASATPWLYVAGFVATTAALHLAGTGVGVAIRRSQWARMAASGLVSAMGVALLVGV
jgi:urease accessory protein